MNEEFDEFLSKQSHRLRTHFDDEQDIRDMQRRIKWLCIEKFDEWYYIDKQMELLIEKKMNDLLVVIKNHKVIIAEHSIELDKVQFQYDNTKQELLELTKLYV